MKTHVVIPDDLLQRVDDMAARLKVKRDDLFRLALEQFIRHHQDHDITARINAFIEQHGQLTDPLWTNQGIRALRNIEW